MTSMDALRAFAEVLGLELTVSDWMLVRLKDCDGMWYRAYRACITLSGYGDDDALTACPLVDEMVVYRWPLAEKAVKEEAMDVMANDMLTKIWADAQKGGVQG